MGFVSDLVLDAMLSFSAYHLRSLSPSYTHSNPSPDNSELEAAESRYLSRALSLQRAALQNLQNMDPREIFSAALFMFHYIWLTENTIAITPPYNLPTRIYHLARGSKDLFGALPDMGLQHYELYCPRIDLVTAIRPNPSTFIESALQDCDHLALFLEYYTPPYISSLASLPAEEAQAKDRLVLIQTLQNLREMINTFTAPQAFPAAQNMLALFPLRTESRFEEMLDEQNLVAMGLLARNFALVHGVEWVWWLHGGDGELKGTIARGNVLGIQGLLLEVGGMWDWIMRWPVAVIEGRIKFDIL